MSSSLKTQSTLLRELAEFFSAAPSMQQILEFKPSDATTQRASELLELNRRGTLDHQASRELDQFEYAETLMRLVKATIRASAGDEK